jgi:hypothetical protein
LALPILLVFLAGTVSLAAALSAFIVSRAFDRSAFCSICYAAATFTAVFTLILLALTFVESAGQHDVHSRGGSSAVDTSVIMNGTAESQARIAGPRETHLRAAGYVPGRTYCRDQRSSGRYEKVELGDGNGSTT